MLSDAVTAAEFLLTLAAEVIVALVVLAYAMHCLIVVARETAAGNDEVFWPSEPFQDWVGGALHLVLAAVVWLAPIGLLARSLGRQWLPDQPALRFLLLAVPGLWLFFPVALLSSLSGSSRWFVFRPVVVWNLLRVAPSAFVVYLLSGLLAVAAAALCYASVVSRWIIFTPLAAAGLAAALLVYARLLGVLAWKMGRLPAGRQKKRKKARLKGPSAHAHDPWAVPDLPAEEPQPTTETTPYGKTRPRVKGYGLAAGEPVKRPEATPPDEVRAAYTPKPAAPARRSLLGGVFTFPGYVQTRKPWLLLSLGFLAVFAGAYALLSLFAQLFKGG